MPLLDPIKQLAGTVKLTLTVRGGGNEVSRSVEILASRLDDAALHKWLDERLARVREAGIPQERELSTGSGDPPTQ